MTKDPELEVNPSPLYWARIVRNEDGDGHISHSMAFDPAYGPESQAQLDYWRKRGYPGADQWEIGKPIKVPPPRVAFDAMATAAERGGKS